MCHHNYFARMRRRLAVLLVPFIWLTCSALAAADTDPPGRVARVNYLEGSGSMQAAGVDGWSDDLLNRPLTGGDRVWIDEDSRAEMHVGSTALRLGARTAVQVLAVDDRSVRLSLTAGSLSVHIRELERDDHFDIETPAGEIALQQAGGYRVDVDDSNGRAYLAVWTGGAEVSGPYAARTVREGQSAELAAGAEPAIDTATAGDTDSLDLWAEDRDQRENQSAAADYVSRDVVGYQDLDGYGQWVAEPVYGMVWVPVVAAGWAPYHYGYWNWIAPWGWTWIASEPWGFAPCHYGRWVHARHGWAWAPGPRSGPRPVYAPALVAWRGDRYPKTNQDIAHRPKVGWVPLGFNEVYDPPFRASRDYLRATNLTNTHLAHAEVDRYIDERQHSGARGPERRYANDNVAGAYADAPREAFASTHSSPPPRAPAAPNPSVPPKFVPHEVWRTAPADRPVVVAHPVGYAPLAPPDRPQVPVATRGHIEASEPRDRPPPRQTVVVRPAQSPPAAPPQQPHRQMQPAENEPSPRQYAPAPVRSNAPVPAAPVHGAAPAPASPTRGNAPAPAAMAVGAGDTPAQVGRPVR